MVGIRHTFNQVNSLLLFIISSACGWKGVSLFSKIRLIVLTMPYNAFKKSCYLFYRPYSILMALKTASDVSRSNNVRISPSSL